MPRIGDSKYHNIVSRNRGLLLFGEVFDCQINVVHSKALYFADVESNQHPARCWIGVEALLMRAFL